MNIQERMEFIQLFERVKVLENAVKALQEPKPVEVPPKEKRGPGRPPKESK